MDSYWPGLMQYLLMSIIRVGFSPTFLPLSKRPRPLSLVFPFLLRQEKLRTVSFLLRTCCFQFPYLPGDCVIERFFMTCQSAQSILPCSTLQLPHFPVTAFLKLRQGLDYFLHSENFSAGKTVHHLNFFTDASHSFRLFPYPVGSIPSICKLLY